MDIKRKHILEKKKLNIIYTISVITKLIFNFQMEMENDYQKC